MPPFPKDKEEEEEEKQKNATKLPPPPPAPAAKVDAARRPTMLVPVPPVKPLVHSSATAILGAHGDVVLPVVLPAESSRQATQTGSASSMDAHDSKPSRPRLMRQQQRPMRSP